MVGDSPYGGGRKRLRVFIAGIDGYLGWSLVQYLLGRGHDVGGADAFLRRSWVDEMGSWSAIPIHSMPDRLSALRERFGGRVPFWEADLTDYDVVHRMLEEFQPDCVVHLG